MIRRIRFANRLPFVLVLVFFSECGFDDSRQIGKDTKIIELQNGLDLVVTTFNYGLNGQHERIVLSKDTLRGLQPEPPTSPVIYGDVLALLLDTLPAAILYTSYEPKNEESFDQFDGKLIFKKIGGSDLFRMSKSESQNIMKISRTESY